MERKSKQGGGSLAHGVDKLAHGVDILAHGVDISKKNTFTNTESPLSGFINICESRLFNRWFLNHTEYGILNPTLST